MYCDEAVSEEPAAAVAAPEAQHATEPIATGVFAQGDWTDDQFVKELDSIFDNDVSPSFARPLLSHTDLKLHRYPLPGYKRPGQL